MLTRRERGSMPPMELAIAHATDVARTWDVETQVLVNGQGRFRVTLAGVRFESDERLLGEVGPDGTFFIDCTQDAA